MFFDKRINLFYSLFCGITCGVLSDLPPVPRAGAQAIAHPRLRPLLADLSGVNKISPLRDGRKNQYSQKYSAVPKSHTAFLCVYFLWAQTKKMDKYNHRYYSLLVTYKGNSILSANYSTISHEIIFVKKTIPHKKFTYQQIV